MEKNDAVTMVIAQTLKNYFKMKRMSQSEIGEKLNATQQSVSAYISGTRRFGRNTARKWAEAFGFNYSFLMTGEGNLLKEGSFETAAVTNNTSSGDMVINSPNTSIHKDSCAEDLRVYKVLYEEERDENVKLRMKILKLMDKLSELGMPCDC